MTMASFLLT
jgi:hypothetical protein